MAKTVSSSKRVISTWTPTKAEADRIDGGTPNQKILPQRIIPLQTAEKLICGDREGDYGSPKVSFDSIAALWTAYLHARKLLHPANRVLGSDVSQLMVLLKISRTATGGPKPDNFHDQAGYTGLSYELFSKEGSLK